jgi:hypothetical protein
MIRQGRIRAKYSLIWIFICLGLIILNFFPFLLHSLSQLFGFQTPSNFFLTGIIFLLICISIHLSIVLSRAEDNIRDMAEDFAILKDQVNELEHAHDRESEVVSKSP